MSHPLTIVASMTSARPLTWRLKWLLFNLRAGIAESYPPCCVVRFCAEGLWNPRRPQALFRAGTCRGAGYVPCSWVHEASSRPILSLGDASLSALAPWTKADRSALMADPPKAYFASVVSSVR